MLAVFLCFFSWYGFDAISRLPVLGRMDFLLVQSGMQEHYRSLSRGVVDTPDLVWFASVILFFLLAARFSLNGWKRSLKGLSGWTIGLILGNVILVNYFTRLNLPADHTRTAEHRVGKGCVSTGRTR